MANARQPSTKAAKRNTSWIKPPPSMIKLNFDGAIFAYLDGVGIAVVARDHLGCCTAWKSEFFAGIKEAVVAEALAARGAADLIAQYAWDNIIIEGDCLKVIHDLQNKKRITLDDKSGMYVFIGRDVEFDEEGIWEWNDQNKNYHYSSFFDDDEENMAQPITPPSTPQPQNIQADEASSSEGPRGFRGNNPKMFDDFKRAMAKEFEMTDIDLMSYYLGIEVK
ncbi:hypothetical protein Salat_1661800 [Sesamum alatum]|uniref:RNase H type-1 domain-containing protein n=1 Tax=Sesamum alatum TaxID=300844 RepID=A0AAE2CJP9_9LAMI|nr:hypothetical protein Salat_1661800 [Sesamum alatum]